LSVNPFAEFREECRKSLQQAMVKLYPKLIVPDISFETPPTPEFGELASSICFELAKQLRKKPIALAEEIVSVVDKSKLQFVETVKAAGEGYVNFYVNYSKLAESAVESARKQIKYGYVKTDKPVEVIVEHTSANPIHPLHIGAARNPILGDALARMLMARGHKVLRHFYIDDVGRQTAIITYGYEKLGGETYYLAERLKAPTRIKPDHLIGQIYAITSCIVTIRFLDKHIKGLQEKAVQREHARKLQADLDDWMAAAADLEERYPDMFNKLASEIKKDPDPEAKITSLIQRYESGEENAKKIIREVSELCLQGFKETLSRVDIKLDSWDWESDIVWSGRVSKVLQQLQKTPYVSRSAGVLELNAEQAAESLNLKTILGLSEDYPLPSLTLTRSDGTTLYTTRDIAYSLWKFERANRVINVVGVEQSLAQLQLRIALCVLGKVEMAKNQTHFAIGLVELPGYKMSSRRGRYITFDQVIDEAIKRAYEEVSKRSPELTEDEKRKISEIVGVGAIKYALISVEPAKNVTFTWDRVLDFEKNSAPFVQYAHARACNILKKAKTKLDKVKYDVLKHQLEKDLILFVAKFPEIFVDAVENLKPDSLANFANNLADRFNSFYASLPVIQAESKELGEARLALVDAVRVVLNNSLTLLGIEPLERM